MVCPFLPPKTSTCRATTECVPQMLGDERSIMQGIRESLVYVAELKGNPIEIRQVRVSEDQRTYGLDGTKYTWYASLGSREVGGRRDSVLGRILVAIGSLTQRRTAIPVNNVISSKDSFHRNRCNELGKGRA